MQFQHSEFQGVGAAPAVVMPALADADLPELPNPLPGVQAWWCLVQPWTPPNESKGGIIISSATQEMILHNQYLCKLVAMGPYAFKHERLNPGGQAIVPKIGDWVMISRLQGVEFEYQNPDIEDAPTVRLRMCEDQAIMATLDTPKGWKIGGVV